MPTFDALGRSRELLTAHLHFVLGGQRERDLEILAIVQHDLLAAVYDNPDRINELITGLAGTAVSAFADLAGDLHGEPLARWQRICQALSDQPD